MSALAMKYSLRIWICQVIDVLTSSQSNRSIVRCTPLIQIADTQSNFFATTERAVSEDGAVGRVGIRLARIIRSNANDAATGHHPNGNFVPNVFGSQSGDT